jgi:hypothetical protein
MPTANPTQGRTLTTVLLVAEDSATAMRIEVEAMIPPEVNVEKAFDGADEVALISDVRMSIGAEADCIFDASRLSYCPDLDG